MISNESIQSVLTLWNRRDLPAREIAEQLNLPYGRVYYILRRHKGSGKSRRHPKLRTDPVSPETESGTDRKYSGMGHGEPQRMPSHSRCPRCGVLVQMPCLACRLAESGPWHVPETGEAAATIACDLHGDELNRYLDLKHRKDFGLPTSF
jgi:hypothetical protein